MVRASRDWALERTFADMSALPVTAKVLRELEFLVAEVTDSFLRAWLIELFQSMSVSLQRS